jgi:putative component of membrane protein insertase Oxa1/YidC/SpoIIIJ protein YidD
MKNENFDHLPTSQELAEIYMRTEANNPASLYYKRKLPKPKFPLWRLILFFVLIPCFCILIALFVNAIFKKNYITVITSVILLLLYVLIFAKNMLITLVLVYQALAPKKIRERCRYEPSCSQYMLLSLKKYGFFKGLRKGLKRWKGCKPPNGGFDMP